MADEGALAIRVAKLQAELDKTAKQTPKAWQPLPAPPAEENGKLLSPILNVGPMPTVLVLDIAKDSI